MVLCCVSTNLEPFFLFRTHFGDKLKVSCLILPALVEQKTKKDSCKTRKKSHISRNSNFCLQFASWHFRGNFRKPTHTPKTARSTARNGPFARYASLDEECSRADHPPHLAKENSTNSLNRLHAAMVLDSVAAFKHSTQSLPRTTTNGDFQAAEPMRAGSLTRAGAAALQAKAIASRELPLDIRPQVNRFVTYHASGSDSGNGSGDSVQSPAASEMDAVPHAQQRGVVIRPPHFLAHSLSSMTLKSLADVDYAELERSVLAMERPDIEPPVTRFDVDNFATLLLPSVENQPLDKDALTTVRMILGETAPRLIANCLSRIDAQLMLDERRAAGDADNGTRAAEVRGCSGIELMTLPHGRQFRVDLVERTECIRLMVAVTILTCADDGERAETLDRWIQIANDTKTALGNLYGFSNIMIGLCMPQVSGRCDG